MADPVWQNRIVGHGTIDPEDLLANPRNWRIHPKVQQEALQGVLEEVGWVDEVIVNQKTGFVVDGHLRVALAIKNHEPEIPVQYIDVSEEQEMLVLATLDPLAALAVADTDKLGELLSELHLEDERVGTLLKGLQDEVMAKSFVPPDLDGLGEGYGEHDPEDLWPIIRVKVSPLTFRRWNSVLLDQVGENDDEKVNSLLDHLG
jgi:ParB-like chromosome segregation protein Spo0J